MMKWAEVIADKSLQDLPYKIELDRYGNILMSPASNRHGRLQVRIASLLERLLGGEAISECSIDTPEGVKVADVAWCSPEFLARHGYETPYSSAPEICVEIRSPSNSEEEIRFKVGLYLEQGAKEVWIVLETGSVRFFGPEGERSESSFPIDPRPELSH
ncbi:Uma2 family endonuclease [Methylocaldum szegediense]|uniref:Uma2 domain-containing protein n=1 Tax=Methylocaldum szegediense TaxID=73780 RepID=A0ABN8X5B0_9GAMM|nr:Uma2 family endonuclease [Methylocaldum szegediense]CAI8886098.1 Uma2 domain-containing protein [Methylocaldum szegediense]